jgi:hypothetical protein
MKVKKTQTTYIVEGEDETELIPEGTTFVRVNYAGGEPYHIFYQANFEEEDLDKRSKMLEELNSSAPTTQTGIEKVVELLESSQ